MPLVNKTVLPRYGSRVAVVPVPSDPAVWREATREQLAVLLAVMAEPEFSYFSVADKSGATREQIDCALAYWEGAGVLTLAAADNAAPLPAAARHVPPQAVPTQENAPRMRSELPRYSSEELARKLEANPTAATLIDCCAQELGKIFNTAESEIIVGLLDYLSMDPEYVLLLFAHCAKSGHKSLRYIEKMAIELYDAGIVTYEQLDVYLRRLEKTDDAEARLRDMFGIGRRALVKREREAFRRWIGEWEMPLDVVEYAYEITVNNTREPSVPYTDAILEKWHAEGYKTLSEVQAAQAARTGKTPKDGSFNTDDFFDEALKRSYGN